MSESQSVKSSVHSKVESASVKTAKAPSVKSGISDGSGAN